MALRDTLHQISDAEAEVKKGRVQFWGQLSRSEASLMKQLPELVPTTRVVVTPVCRSRCYGCTAEDDTKARVEDIGKHFRQFPSGMKVFPQRKQSHVLCHSAKEIFHSS